MITGECFCAEVRYEYSGTLSDVTSCHCSQCRKAFSSQASAYALVDHIDFKWIHGFDKLRSYKNKQGFGLQFCSLCGSTVCGVHNELVHGVTLGCVNGDPPVKISRHIYVGSKAAWEDIGGDAPQFHENQPKNQK